MGEKRFRARPSTNRDPCVKIFSVTRPKIPTIIMESYFSNFEIIEFALILIPLFSLHSNIKYHFFPSW